MEDSDEGPIPQYGNAGQPLIDVYPGTHSGCLAEVIFLEDVGSVQGLVQDHKELIHQDIEHWGPLYSEWVKRSPDSRGLEDWPADTWEPPRKIEPALIFACLVPLYKHPDPGRHAPLMECLIEAMKRKKVGLNTLELRTPDEIWLGQRKSLLGLTLAPATLLHQAAGWQNSAVIQPLVDAGACVRQTDENGRSPFHCVCTEETMYHSGGFELTDTHSYKQRRLLRLPLNELEVFVWAPQLDAAIQLLKNDSDVNAVDSFGRTLP